HRRRQMGRGRHSDGPALSHYSGVGGKKVLALRPIWRSPAPIVAEPSRPRIAAIRIVDMSARPPTRGGVGACFVRLNLPQAIERAASDLADGKALGWFQGRMEFGPRALGNRSILADPCTSSMQSALNLKIKYRGSFRPFAPAVLREDLSEWFEL